MPSEAEQLWLGVILVQAFTNLMEHLLLSVVCLVREFVLCLELGASRRTHLTLADARRANKFVANQTAQRVQSLRSYVTLAFYSIPLELATARRCLLREFKVKK